MRGTREAIDGLEGLVCALAGDLEELEGGIGRKEEVLREAASQAETLREGLSSATMKVEASGVTLERLRADAIAWRSRSLDAAVSRWALCSWRDSLRKMRAVSKCASRLRGVCVWGAFALWREQVAEHQRARHVTLSWKTRPSRWQETLSPKT